MNAVRDLQFSVLDKDEVSALLLLPPKASCLLVMAHGAGAGMNHSFMTAMANNWPPWVSARCAINSLTWSSAVAFLIRSRFCSQPWRRP